MLDTPEVASLAVRVTVLVSSPVVSPETVGLTVSIWTDSDLTASTLPTVSVERYSTRRVPSPVTETAAVYGVQAPPAIRYSVEATPDPPVPSVAAKVNDGRVVYQPAALAAEMVSVVVGAVVSDGAGGLHVSSLPSVK